MTAALKATEMENEADLVMHTVKVHPEKDRLPKEQQLAWKIAEMAADDVPVDEIAQ